MRLNRYIATYTDLSRRKADLLIESGVVAVNRTPAHVGMEVSASDTVIIDGKRLVPIKRKDITILLNKPVGYVCSKDGQGSPTVYDLLPKGFQHANVAGRLDKDSSGLVVLTSDGQLLQELSHPSYNKNKVYEVTVDKELSPELLRKINEGVHIGDERPSKMRIAPTAALDYEVTLTEGRNRQIRRTFEALKIKVMTLQRTKIGPYRLDRLPSEQFLEI